MRKLLSHVAPVPAFSEFGVLLSRIRGLELEGSLRGPIIVAVAYFIGAEIAFLIGTLSDRIFAPFWPPNVVLFCALLLDAGTPLVALHRGGVSALM